MPSVKKIFDSFKEDAKKVTKKFSDIKITTGQKKPDAKKNFFQNYVDHLEFLERRYSHQLKNNQYQIKNLGEMAFVGSSSLLDAKHLLIFEPLRDGHDYADEFLGASLIPLASSLVSIGSLLTAFSELAQMALIKASLMRNNHEDHTDKAISYLAASATSILLCLASLFKSVVSIFSRPFVTMIQGWKPQDEVRFINDNSAESQIGRMAEDLLSF